MSILRSFVEIRPMVIIFYANHVLGAPKRKGKTREILSKCTSETLHTDDRELPTDFFFRDAINRLGMGFGFVLLQLCSYLKIGCYRFLLLEPVCCKKQQKKFLTSYWFVE